MAASTGDRIELVAPRVRERRPQRAAQPHVTDVNGAEVQQPDRLRLGPSTQRHIEDARQLAVVLRLCGEGEIALRFE
ncbi:hypothetical protein ACWGCW_18745 [Streptomyces sp. NPDC054933]